METIFNHFGEIADTLQLLCEDAEKTIAQQAVGHIKEHIIINGQVKTGEMLDSVEVQTDTNGETNVVVGVDYAVYQNYGTRYIPPRPFFEPGLEDTQTNIDSVMQSVVGKLETEF